MRVQCCGNTLLVTITVYWSLLASKLCTVLAAANSPVTSDETGKTGDRRLADIDGLSLLQDIIVKSLHEFSPEYASKLDIAGLFEKGRFSESYEYDVTGDEYDISSDNDDVIATPEEELLRSSFFPTGLHDGERLAEQLTVLRSGSVVQHLVNAVSDSVMRFENLTVIQDLLDCFDDINITFPFPLNSANDNLYQQQQRSKTEWTESESAYSAAVDGEFHEATKGRGPERNQTGDYEGCRRDYAQLAEPVTDRLIAAVHGVVYTTINTLCSIECRDWPIRFRPVCNQLCPSQFPPPPVPTKNYTADTLDIIDSIGKIPTGILEGKIHWPGSWEYCQSQVVHYTYYNHTYMQPGVAIEQREFIGKYARLRFTLPVPRLPFPLRIAVGVCVPDTCNSEDVNQYITGGDNKVFCALHAVTRRLNLSYVYLGQQDYVDFKTDAWAKTCLIVNFILGGIVVVASLYDAFLRKKIYTWKYLDLKAKDSKISLISKLEVAFVGFSAYSNTFTIFGAKRRFTNEIPALHGIRTLSLIWAYWAIAYIYGPLASEIWMSSNVISALLEFPRQFWFQIIINAHFFSDSMLLCSGLLVTYHWLNKYTQQRLTITGILGYILHSYWKLAPTVAWVILGYASMWRYIGKGPFYPLNLHDAMNCKTHGWWVNVLMLNNLINVDNMCLLPTWLLPILFQLWIFSLVILIPLLIIPKLAYGLLIISYIAHIVVTAYISADSYRRPLAGLTDHFLTPWCRAGPYLIGMTLGIILHKYRGKQIRMHWVSVMVGWLVSVGLLLTVTFVTYDRYKEGGNRWSRTDIAAYYTLNRQAWALGLAWIVFACAKGLAGGVNAFLSWGAFRSLSHILLGATCLPLLFIWVYYQMTLVYIDHYNMVYICIGHVIYVFVGGYLCAMLVQFPLSKGLERALALTSKVEALAAGSHRAEDKPAVEAWRKRQQAGLLTTDLDHKSH